MPLYGAPKAPSIFFFFFCIAIVPLQKDASDPPYQNVPFLELLLSIRHPVPETAFVNWKPWPIWNIWREWSYQFKPRQTTCVYLVSAHFQLHQCPRSLLTYHDSRLGAGMQESLDKITMQYTNVTMHCVWFVIVSRVVQQYLP